MLTFRRKQFFALILLFECVNIIIITQINFEEISVYIWDNLSLKGLISISHFMKMVNFATKSFA